MMEEKSPNLVGRLCKGEWNRKYHIVTLYERMHLYLDSNKVHFIQMMTYQLFQGHFNILSGVKIGSLMKRANSPKKTATKPDAP